MTGSVAFTFADPQPYEAAVHPSQIEVFVTAKGDFHADLIRVELCRGGYPHGCKRLGLPGTVRFNGKIHKLPFDLGPVELATTELEQVHEAIRKSKD